jgi:hypothetical protein
VLRRPHHQLGIESLEGEGRKAKLTPLKIYLPDNIEGADISDSAAVMPFVNLLERFGFAIDLAVVDALNQPLQQARLVDWIDSQNWKAIRSSIDREINHEIVLITGREPDTDRDQLDTLDQSLGYAFIKLAVVPHNILADLLERVIEVDVEAQYTPADGTPGSTNNLNLKFPNQNKSSFESLWSGNSEISIPKLSNFDLTNKPIKFTLQGLTDTGAASSEVIIGYDGGPTPIATIEKVDITSSSDRLSFRNWLVQRSMLDSKVAEAEPKPNELIELGIVKRMVELWLREIYPLKGKNDPLDLGHVIVETRGRRWATVPILGGRAHIDWEAFDSAGHEVNIAVRRVSRYEALLRWARGTAVPTLNRIYGLEPAYYQTIDFRRRIQVDVEEPIALPVLISPHPTKIDFIYALPTSGARATISGLSARRNGYQGLIARFIQERRLMVVKGFSNDAHKTILMSSGIKEDDRLIKLTVNNIDTWEVTPVPALDKFDALVVFSKDRKQVRLCSIFTLTTAPSGTLTFSLDEGGLTGISNNDVLSALVHPISDPVLTYMSLKGSITRIETTNEFRLTLNEAFDCLDDDPRTYIGQLLIVLNGTDPIHARLIDGFRASDQALTLNTDPLPDSVIKAPVRILFRAKLPLRDRIDYSESGALVLYRNERLISLPALPYYRKYSVELKPHFNATEIGLQKDGTQPILENVYGQRKPSAIATHPAHLVEKSSSGTENVYEFRLVLSRQGDLLTPAEIKSEDNLVKDENNLVKDSERLRRLKPDFDFQPLPADLPDLLCLYQVVWPLPALSSTAFVNNAAYLDLFDVILPGHPLWTPPPLPATNYVLVRNRSGTNNAILQDNGVDIGDNLYIPISLWCPRSNAQPTYIINVSIKILEPGIALFGSPDLALLQVQRDGSRSRPIPIPQLKNP